MLNPRSLATDETPGLDDLIDQLDLAVTLPGSAIPSAVAAALASVMQACDVVSPAQQVGSAERYTRHVLHSHPKGLYTLVALIWHPGQRTPAHGHHTWCAYRVLEGTLKEERFGWDEDRRVASLNEAVTLDSSKCSSAHAGLEKIHRLSNIGNMRAISLHAYGVDALHVSTHVNNVVEC